MRARTGVVALAVVGGLTLASCSDDAPGETSADLNLNPTDSGDLEVVTTGLEAPWAIAFADQGKVALISERDSARILELGDDGSSREVGVIDGVSPGGEGGLLGIAVTDGEAGEDLYVYFTAEGENRIERYELTGEPGGYGLGEAEVILDGLPAAGTHNGGRLAFGPDGMLYAAVGDAQDQPSAQDPDSYAGTILRMTPEGEAPPDNPFDGSLVYSYGHRNVQGLVWDEDGTLYASEFGANTWDELNVIEPGGNYGWPEVEGIAEQEEFIDPVQQWNPAEASPSGIAIAGDSIYIANLRGERLWRVGLDELGSSTPMLAGQYGRLRDVVLAPDGSLWILTNNTDGRGDPADDDDRILRLTINPPS